MVEIQIDVKGAKLTFKIRKEKNKYNMFKSLKYSSNDHNIYRIDMIEISIREEFGQIIIDDPVKCLITYPR
jgi:hypothetical protein